MHNAGPFARLTAAALLACAFGSASARADIFVLAGNGEVRGELVNRDQAPRKTYVVKTASGGQVTLAADQVAEVKHQTPAEMKYDRVRPEYPLTVEGQWKLAEWCRENRLSKQRKLHLEWILEQDPNHKEARRGLGYSQIGGRWATQEQLMIENGYVRSKQSPGTWVLPQEEELLEKRQKETKAQLEWASKLKRWNAWLNTDKADQAVANINAINDPFAARALAKQLTGESRVNIRMLYVQALGRINSPTGMEALISTSLFDQDDEIRLAARDEVVSRKYMPAVNRYVQALKSKDNPVVNRAAIGLQGLKDPAAIGPLIDALVTTHTFQIQKGQPGQTSAGFGSGPGGGGGGFTFGGGGTETRKINFENRDVLAALVELTSGTSYNFDVRAWKNWFAAKKKPQSLDARRDSQE